MAKARVKPSSRQRRRYVRWLEQVTSIPTAAGREHLVIAWVRQWAAARRDLVLQEDKAGNLFITMKRGRPPRKAGRRTSPVFITAHLDHPAFVVRAVRPNGTIDMDFRGGVHDPYFRNAVVDLFSASSGRPVASARVLRLDSAAKPFKRVTAKLVNSPLGDNSSLGTTAVIRSGDIGRWAFQPTLRRSIIKNGLLRAPACDDLAAVAAALAVLDELRRRPGARHVGVLLTRAEEIGFVGALAACKAKSLPRNARLICLENSRSFPESPIGAGPVLRVGDKSSVFGPELTNRLADVMNDHVSSHPGFKWQRKLMAGGTCEATAFSAFGRRSTCICLPLGNYHNMVDIDGVMAGRRPARLGPEIISIADYLGLIDMLVVCVMNLDAARIPPLTDRLNGLLTAHRHLLRR